VKRHLHDFEGALTDLNDADLLEPNDFDVLRVRGIVKFNLLDLDGALADLDRAHLLQPTNSSIFRYNQLA
jgi:Flp pilus assembly protein TadD